MKNKRIFIFIMLIIVTISISACSSKKIEGKYVAIYNEETYLLFEKDGSIKNSLWYTLEDENKILTDNLIYDIDENNIITMTDTTEYANQDTLEKYEIGLLYKDYICSIWEGKLYKEYTDTKLTLKLLDDIYTISMYLKKDRTYECKTYKNNEIINTENGTYLINGNEVICTSSEGKISPFINIDGNAFCIEYVKQN